MTVTDNVFPQSGDADFAENFATWVGRGNVTDFVETGMDFTVDYTNEVLDLSQGKAFVVVDNKTISSNSETRLVLDYAVTISARTGIALNTDETNNLIYLDAGIGTNDSPVIQVETTTGAAEDDWLLIGVIDTLNNTSETRNRDPSADFETLSTLDTFSAPVYSDSTNASASESSVIYLDGTGSQPTGLYVYDGSSYVSAGIRDISRLDDVTGIESLESNTDGNQPAAGTDGRIYIDETNNRIERDDGNSWITVGTNPSNIGAGDLGFDPATQIELDDHTALSDVHHTRPTAGTGLSDSNNTFNFNPSEVSGTGVEADGSGNIRVDEDFDFTFTSPIDFSAGLDVQGDVTDGTQVIWDVSAQEIPDSAMGSIDVGTLNIGRGLEDDGTGSLQFDEDTDFTFTSAIDFSAGLDTQGDMTDGTQVIWDASAQEIPDSAMGSIDNTTLTNSSVTVSSGTNLTGGGSVSLGGSTTIDHADTSTQGNVSAVAGAAITDVDLDGDGHVTTLGTTSFDSRYVEVTGDTITGLLSMEAEFNANNASGGRVVLPVGTDKFAT